MSDTEAYRIRSDDTWGQARNDYLLGFTAEEVCERYDLGLSALRTRARREGWRRLDQDDPAPVIDDDEDDLDLSLIGLLRSSWKRLGKAIAAGRAAEASRWQRIHAALYARALAEQGAEESDADWRAMDAGKRALFRSPAPRLSPQGDRIAVDAILHDLHPNFPDDGSQEDLSRAERRRRLREDRKRR